jgi:NADH:ubiquinone oxidoreductase subunit 5 (subunit L)/multisubunit Na+/H+ antiporter MnhA subunit
VIGLVAGSAALAGIIPFAGYFSKEAVLGALGEHAGGVALALAYFGAGLTAYYTFRMVFLTLRVPAYRRTGVPFGDSRRWRCSCASPPPRRPSSPPSSPPRRTPACSAARSA